MSRALSPLKVQRAATELEAMRGALRRWLKARALNDAVRSGQVPSTTGYTPQRSWAIEQDLAVKLHTLLAELMPDARLPDPDVQRNPSAAVQLAQIALTGNAPAATPNAQGGTMPWLWPVLIVGGLLLAVTTAITSAAEVAKDREEKECIRAGACTDSGFWLKWAAIIGLGWFAWKELGVGRAVRQLMAKGRS